MSDLRTRIATAIYMQEYPKRCEHCPTPHPSPWAFKVADALIAELKNDPGIMFMTHVCEEGCSCE